MNEDHLRVALTVLRIVRGWNQEELAHAARVRPGTISYYELGKLVPSLRTLQRLTGVMGYPLSAVEEAQSFVATLRAQSALRSAATLQDESGETEGETHPSAPHPLGLRTSPSRWEIEQTAIEVGRVATRITRLLFTLKESPGPEPAAGAPPADAA